MANKKKKNDPSAAKGLQPKKQKTEIPKKKIDIKKIAGISCLVGGLFCVFLNFVSNIGEGYLSFVGLGLICAGILMR